MKPRRPLPPYILELPDGSHHLSIPDLLRAFGIPDTPHNRDVATTAAVEAFRESFPGVDVVVMEQNYVRGSN